MAILTFPTIRQPSQASFVLLGNTQTQQSPFTGSVQTLAMPGARWRGTYVWDSLRLEEWRAVSAFQAQLLGAAGRFYMRPLHAWRRANCPGAVEVNGAGQTGSTIATRGWDPPGDAVLMGDFISVPNAAGRPMLHMATQDNAPAPDGTCNFTLSPPLRSSPADGSTVTYGAPLGVFRLLQDDAGEMRITPPYKGSFTLDFEEALFG